MSSGFLRTYCCGSEVDYKWSTKRWDNFFKIGKILDRHSGMKN